MTLRRKLGWVAVLYFAESLPFGVVREVMPVYLRYSGVDLAAIGLYSLMGLPWTFKVVWSPLIDRYGDRRTWMAVCLAVIAIATAALGSIPPTAAVLVGVVMLLIAFASATQDIAIDAYTIGLVEPGEEGSANGVRVTAGRIALIASGGGLVLLSTWLGWPAAFGVAAGSLALLALLVPWAPRVAVSAESRRHWLAPLRDWVARPGATAVFAFVLLYKLGDAAMGPMIKPFWLDSGLSVGEVGVVSSTVGMFATIAGAIAGGRFTDRFGIWRALLVLGLAQALSNFGYATAAWLAPPHPATSVQTMADILGAIREPARALIYTASMIESFTSGLGTAAFLSFLMNICDKEHAAVQYAGLSALFGLSRDAAGAVSGWAVQTVGYAAWFTLTVGLAVPALLLLPRIRPWIRESS
ncbi:MAG TPA: MFS transporter [Candidatus Dormibacteraeota bacterium]|nr:MFS transporter [Candidatus Dormibacteraeota bacterium]